MSIVTIVLGVNDDAYDPSRHRIVSNASCTTNCVKPMAKVLPRRVRDRARRHDHRPRRHADTPTQALLDGPHKDLAGARAAAVNLIPTTTGATRALGRVLPEVGDRSPRLRSELRCPSARSSISSPSYRGRPIATRSTPPSAPPLLAEILR
jgi:glyceraldehyde 3-phosphate dehydrogenase